MANVNMFKVSNFSLNLKDQTNIELMAVDVVIPGLTLGELSIPRPVVRDLRLGDTLTYEDLTISCLCDEDLLAYSDVYNYITKSANPESGDINIAYPVFDSTLFLTTNKNNVQYKVTFYNCFFKNIGGINLTSQSTEEEQFTFSITLGYSYYIFSKQL